ncbi:MAG: heme-binding domain-containing protein [Chitinophagales bacterium]
MKAKWTKRILLALLVFLVVAQFFPIDKSNPPINSSADYLQTSQVPAAMATLIKSACYDCHSNETQYPWYTNVAPISWWVKDHINHGREHLNFSTWSDYSTKKQAHKMEECWEEVEATKMPMLPYIIAHSEARMSEEERASLVAWFKQEEGRVAASGN